MGRSVVGNKNILYGLYSVLFLNIDMTVVGIQKTENKITDIQTVLPKEMLRRTRQVKVGLDRRQLMDLQD